VVLTEGVRGALRLLPNAVTRELLEGAQFALG
jgi:hypothetical protein